MKDRIINQYFEWMFDLVCCRKKSYRKLLIQLHNTPFEYTLERDDNRAQDGMDLRLRFIDFMSYSKDVLDYLDGPCSVLEMMMALSVRCEEHIMGDPEIGDRTGKWFWGMIKNMQLDNMTDDTYDKEYVSERLYIMMNREYNPYGEGGLFTVHHVNKDLRRCEIWYQMCWYLDRMI